MIAGQFFQGSGLGNQIARYVAVRCLALDLGYDFGMVNPENFKGSSFLNLDMGKPVEGLTREFQEKKIVHKNGTDIREYDERIKKINNNTLVDGEFQDERYFMHHIDEVKTWFKTWGMGIADNVCVINFRGGEYVGLSDLFLTKDYWDNAIKNMRKVRPDMDFMVVTDDVVTARQFFPDFDISHNMEEDWRAIKYAPYLILSNSSFAIMPAILNENVKKIISPMYWARHNVSDGYWALPQNIYTGWYYQNRKGQLYVYTGEQLQYKP